MNVQEISISDLHPYENNPRDNDAAVKPVTESIKQFGFKVPIVIDGNNTIVCGHTRYEAAKRLKMKTLPCVIADDLTEAQIKAFRLADNKTAEFSEWDEDLLNIELEALQELDEIDLEPFGFETDIFESINDEGHASLIRAEHKLSCGKVKTILTEDEYEDFLAAFNDYVECNGVSYGFIGGLLND